MKWIDNVRDDKPFFVFIPTNTPHVPEIVPESYSKPYLGQYKGKPIPAVFYGMIANIDENLGRLEAFLAARKMKDNTILIYTADNGSQNRNAMALYNAGMRDRKGSVMDGGHRVPMFIRWKDGKLQHGKDIADLAVVQDLLPTLAEFCGLDLGGATVDGTSLAGLLKGEQATLQERTLVTQIGYTCEKWNQAVVMHDKWRLLNNGRLYNIGDDPGQTKNVAAEHPEVAKRLSDHYDKWYAAARPQWEKKRYITIGHPRANPLTLYASDWQGDYCDNRGGLVKATGKGYWDLIVHEDGDYQFELRRWSEESGKVLTEAFDPSKKPPANAKGKGKRRVVSGARPIAGAKLSIAGIDRAADTKADDTVVVFTVPLKAGKQQLRTSFLDKAGEVLCSAPYVKVTKK
jgi:hypothetical protein